MNTLLWVLTGLLAVLFLAAGAAKLLQPKEKVVATSGAWAADYSPGAIKAIGLLEILGALGTVLPAAVDTAVGLVPAAATGLGLLMIGAGAVHARRGEGRNVAVNALLLAMAAVVAWGRFGPYAF
ncbi:DoxX family protein [Streptomyces sp. GS7]|uniref:DoxX family protein n=1 Tax=Streptomyces sp. GS7 TaxID=2692234 RepID=UPI0013161D87|nr:DoxX family protein [Streptomyces sp. GS7]QHC22724.1 DoxX family protein [Streptomyces sp. GS7]